MKRFFLSLAWSVSVGAAFFAGIQLAPSESSRASYVPTRPSEQPDFDGAREGVAFSTGPKSSRIREISKAVSQKQPEERILEISLLADPLERTAALTALLEGLRDSAEFYALVDSFRAMGITQERMGDYGLMLSAWAKVDPTGALDYANENTGTPFARQTILTAWAGYDADAAIRWAEDNHDGDGANLWMVGVIRGVANANLPLATSLMADLPRSRERGQALEALVQQFAISKPDEAIDWATSLQADDRLKNAAQNRIAALVAEKDLESALDWMDELASVDGARRNAIDEVTAVWAKEDPDAAIAYTNQLPAEERGQAAEGVMRSLARLDPVKAEEFLASLQGQEDLGEATQNFVWGAYERAPELTVNYIEDIPSDRRRERAYRRVLDRWVQTDRDLAIAWIETAEDLSDAVRDRFLEQ